MPIERSPRPIAGSRLVKVARSLLNASTLCAIATVDPVARAHVNTAYFAWTSRLDLIWLSEPHARHSRNLRAYPAAAIAVYDSNQSWGKPDRGIQLFGTAHEVSRLETQECETAYVRRFPAYVATELAAYRFYRFRPRRVKLFDERALGTGTFVTARVGKDGTLTWERTELYRPSA